MWPFLFPGHLCIESPAAFSDRIFKIMPALPVSQGSVGSSLNLFLMLKLLCRKDLVNGQKSDVFEYV